MNLAFKQAKQVAVLVLYQGAPFFCLSPCQGDGGDTPSMQDLPAE